MSFTTNNPPIIAQYPRPIAKPSITHSKWETMTITWDCNVMLYLESAQRNASRCKRDFQLNEWIRDEFIFSISGIPVTRLWGPHIWGIVIHVPVTTLTFSQMRGRKDLLPPKNATSGAEGAMMMVSLEAINMPLKTGNIHRSCLLAILRRSEECYVNNEELVSSLLWLPENTQHQSTNMPVLSSHTTWYYAHRIFFHAYT